MDTITTATPKQAPPANSLLIPATAWFGTQRGVAQPVQLTQYDDTLPVLAVALYLNGQPYTVPDGAAVNVRMDKRDGHYIYNPAYGLSDDRKIVYVAVTLQMTTGAGEYWPILELVVGGDVAGTSVLPLYIAKNPVPEDAVESTDEWKSIQQIAEEVEEATQVVQDNAEGLQWIRDNADTVEAVAGNADNIAAVAGNTSNINTVAASASNINTVVSEMEEIKAAPTAASNAADSATQAGAAATLSESWAVGGTGTRDGEDTNNAKYYAEQAQQVAQGAMGWYATPQALQSAHPTGQNGQWAIVGTTDTIWIWDSDTSAWVDSGSNMDLSQYYTKTEADARFGTVQQVQQAQSAATAAQSAADNAQSAAEQAQATANAAAVIEKIWQNPSPTVEYAAQTISVPGLADYDMIIIFTNANGTLPYAYNPPTMAPKMGNNEIHVTSYQGTFTRGFAVNFLLNSIAIGDAYTGGIDNRYLVPALIFGIKF